MPSLGLPSADSARIFALAHYDLETLSVATSAFDEAWEEYCALLPVKPVGAAETRSAMARRIMAAIDKGRRDPAQLKWIALRAG
jgi:hypothetical protein